MLVTDRKTGEKLEISINAVRKTAIKKIFALAKNIKREHATLGEIKRAYPKLNFAKAISWMTVLADCLEIIEKLEELMDTTNKPTIDEKTIRVEKKAELQEALNTYNFGGSRWDYLTGVSATVTYNRNTMGEVRWSCVMNSWLVSQGRMGRTFKIKSPAEGLEFLLKQNRCSLAEALGLEAA